MGEITGGGGYEAPKSSTEVIELEGFRCLVVWLPKLIDLKRAAGRGKDLEVLAELEVLLEEHAVETRRSSELTERAGVLNCTDPRFVFPAYC